MTVRRPSDAWPLRAIYEEMRRLARLPSGPVRFIVDPSDPINAFRAQLVVDTWIEGNMDNGYDRAGMHAGVCWLRGGPKIVNVTEEQYEVFSQVEVRLAVEDFHPPYPTILFNMPPGKMHAHAILHREEAFQLTPPLLVINSMSPDNRHDIVTVCRGRNGKLVEESLGKMHGDVSRDEGDEALRSARVACNMALAMMAFGCQGEFLFPKEVEGDRRLVGRGDRPFRSGEKPSDRIREQPVLLTLDRTVELCHREGSHEPGEPTGRQMPFHWRRGHWRKLATGKVVLVRPCMVRADLLTAPVDDTTTTYE